MSNQELIDQATLQAEQMRDMIYDQSDGEYLIEDMVSGERSDKQRIFNILMLVLTRMYPNFQWSYHESLNPSIRGVLVKWRKK